MASEKVADMVGIFLNNSYGFQVQANKTEPEKVAATVATFLTKLSFLLSNSYIITQNRGCP
jgi:hypothetical protein